MTIVNVLVSAISHMPLWYVWRDSGAAERHGINLRIDVAGWNLGPGPTRRMDERASALLAGEYQFLSGLHQEPYLYRARGDKRLVYIAQAQNNWDDRLVVAPSIESPKDLEGQTILVTSAAPCVRGNLINVLARAGAHTDRIEFRTVPKPPDFRRRLQEVADGVAVAAQVDIPFDRMARSYGLATLQLPEIPVVHNTTLCADRSWLTENRATATAFVRSMVDAIHFFKTEPQAVREILADTICPVLEIDDVGDISHLAETWAVLLSAKPYPHPLAIWNVYALDVARDPAANHVEPLEPWDLGILQDIDYSGYIDDRYGETARNAAVTPLI